MKTLTTNRRSQKVSYRGSVKLFIIVCCTIIFVGFSPKNESHHFDEDGCTGIKVVAALRTELMTMGLTEKITPKDPEKNVLLVLRVEGIPLEKFQEMVDRNAIIIRSGDDHYYPGIIETASETTFTDNNEEIKISPWIVITFSVPKELLNLTLVVGENSTEDLQLNDTILQNLKQWDLL